MMRFAFALIAVLSSAACAAGPAPHRYQQTGSKDQFIYVSAYRVKTPQGHSLGDALCRLAERSVRGLRCPPSLGAVAAGGGLRTPRGVGGPGAKSALVAELPHLKLAIILTRMENSVVSGGGVQQPEDAEDILDMVRASFKIESTAADQSIPEPADDPYYLMVPDAGDVWPIDHNNGLFQGLILNGCTSDAGFDLALESGIITVGGDEYGDVSLTDEVPGHGFYGFRYTIRATGPGGGVSDFIFSGDAIAWCTSNDEV